MYRECVGSKWNKVNGGFIINLTNFNNSKIGIFGLGKTGLDSLNAFLIEETQIIAWDDNKENILRIKKTIKKTKNMMCRTNTK